MYNMFIYLFKTCLLTYFYHVYLFIMDGRTHKLAQYRIFLKCYKNVLKTLSKNWSRHYSSISSYVLILKSTIMMMCEICTSINRKWLFMIITPFMSHLGIKHHHHSYMKKLYYFSTLLLLPPCIIRPVYTNEYKNKIYEWKFARLPTSHVFFCHFINVFFIHHE